MASNSFEKEIDAIKKKLIKLGDTTKLRPASNKDIAYFKETNIPESVCTFYKVAEPSDCIEINEVRMWPIEQLHIENTQMTPGYIIAPLGYPVIGTTITGDVYCLDLNSIVSETSELPVVLASHDEISEESSRKELKESIIKIASSFREFLEMFSQGKLPTDFYDIKD